MMTSRWWVGMVLAATACCGVVVPATQAAERVPNARVLRRCERALLREGVSYANHTNWALARCVRPLMECARGDAASCQLAPGVCAGLPADLADWDRRFQQSVRGACGGIAVQALLTAGFRDRLQEAECAAETLDAFVGCVAASVREESGRVLRRLQPNACDMLNGVGLGGEVPGEICASEGTCPVPGDTGDRYCGGPDDVACPEGFVCDRADALCTVADVPGRCVPAPTSCAAGAPVCGCDGTTYASDCARLQAGATKARDGACDPPAQACGIGAELECSAGFYCDFSANGDCGEGQAGVCAPMRSDECTLCRAFVSGPVCGCDLVTYPDECALAAAGVSKWFDGACP